MTETTDLAVPEIEKQRELAERDRLRGLDDDQLLEGTASVQEERIRVTSMLRKLEDLGLEEIKRRLVARGDKAMLHDLLEACELEDEYSKWEYDLDTLEQAAALLPEAEAAKVLKYVDEALLCPDCGKPAEIVKAHKVAGNPNSISALIRKYGDTSKIGKLLAESRRRSHLDTKLKFKRKMLTA